MGAFSFFHFGTCSRIFLFSFGQRQCLRKEAGTGKTFFIREFYHTCSNTEVSCSFQDCAASVSLRGQLSKSQLYNPWLINSFWLSFSSFSRICQPDCRKIQSPYSPGDCSQRPFLQVMLAGISDGSFGAAVDLAEVHPNLMYLKGWILGSMTCPF